MCKIFSDLLAYFPVLCHSPHQIFGARASTFNVRPIGVGEKVRSGSPHAQFALGSEASNVALIGGDSQRESRQLHFPASMSWERRGCPDECLDKPRILIYQD